MGTIAKYIRPYWGVVILTVLIKLAGAITELFIPYLMEIILDDKVPAGNIRDIYIYGGLMILCALATVGLNVCSNVMSSKSAGKVTLAVRHDLFEKLEHLSARQMDELTTPSAVSRLTSDTYNVNQMLTRVQRLGIRAPILLIGGIIMMMSMDMVLALVLVALLPIIAIVVYCVTKKSIPMHRYQQEVQDDVVRVTQENITGIRVIKALSKTEYEKQRFNNVNNELASAGLRAGLVTSISNPITTLTLNLGLTLAVLVGAYRVNSGGCEGGVLVAFLQYFTQIHMAMMGITRIFMMCSKGIASANRVADVLNLPEDLACQIPQEETNEAAAEQAAPHIEFQNVSFSYTGVGKNIENLSFRLEHGQTLGILGPTGSGKSTIINLLLRLYDPDEGRILIDGQDLKTMPPEVLRGKFGVVFQNDFVSEGTIGDNIRFFRDLSDEELNRAAEDAQAAPFIAEKGNGMESEVLVRGNNLSGGQKQRLLISRALAAKPEILVLDDSSSALDYQTDSKLRQALRKNYRDTTTVLVAQRISSLKHSDLILVLHDGDVIGAGSHDQLMETCEEYRIIANIQMGDGKEEL